MYLCELKIFIISTEKERAERIAELLKDTSPPEDCTYEVSAHTYENPPAAGEDCTFVIDGNIDFLRQYKRNGKERLVFLTTETDMSGFDADILVLADEPWVIPDIDKFNSRLIGIYFARTLGIMKQETDHRRTEICFNTFIDSLPDLVWFKDNGGAHLIVNNEFCGVVEKTKEQTYKQGHNYIWDVPEDDDENGEAVCRRSEDVVVHERRTCEFHERITTKDGMRQLITYKSPLIDFDGRIFGTCGMGHDITDLQNVSKELRIIIDSIPFGVAIVDSDGLVVAINKFLEKFFPGAPESVGHSYSEWDKNLPKEKLGTDHGEDEYRLNMRGQDFVMRFREEPLVDIFGNDIGTIKFIRDVTLRYNFEQQNIKYANTDFLTGLNNRRSLFDHLTGLKENSLISLIMIDLDKFKKVNDTYGHASGDEALTTTANVMKSCFPDAFISRLGGDEFLIAIDEDIELKKIEERTQNLLDSLLQNYLFNEEFNELSASAGIAQERLDKCDTKNIELLMQRADEALYTAKHSGRARYCVSE